MQTATLWRGLLGLENAVVEGVEFDEDGGVLVASVRPSKGKRNRCGQCPRRCPSYDAGSGRRRWRALDLGSVQVFVEADAPRVACRDHGVVVASVPWARHDAGHTRAFDEQVAWLATKTSKTAVTELMRVAWRTVGSIVERVWDDTEGLFDRFADLTRIGIDEISYKRGHKYLTVVVDHGSGRLVWAAPGRDTVTLTAFFDALGEDRCALITHVSADGASWIANAVRGKCPNAILCADPFHIVKWATDALDTVRRQTWAEVRKQARTNDARRPRGRPRSDAPARPDTANATGIKRCRYALLRNPDTLSCKQVIQLDWVVRTHPDLARAYYLKEGLRMIFKLPLDEATEALDKWISWARRSRIDAFVRLQRSIVTHRDAILASIEHGLSNGRIESMNTKIRLITRIAFGFASPDALIALAMLSLGGHRPALPGRK